MALELGPKEFADAIGVKVEQLAALERAGLPFVAKKASGHAYPLPAAVRWYVDHALATRVAGVPPRTTQKELAALVGYSPRQISNLVEEGKVKTVVEDGRRLYPLPAAVHEVIQYIEVRAGAKKEGALGALDAAKLRKLDADAQAAELTLQERRGELLDRVLVERALSELLQALKAQLVQFAPRYESDFVGLESRAKVRKLLKPAIHAEIQRLSAAAAQVGRRIQAIDATADRGDDDGAEPDAAEAEA